MSDQSSMKAYWGQLFQKRYWREVVIGLPPKDPWPPTAEMLGYEFNKARPAKTSQEPASLGMVITRNESYMEIADGQYMRRGFGGMMYTLMALPAIFILASPLYFLFRNGFPLPLILVTLLDFLIFGPLLLWIGYLWKQEMWSYTCKPMRLVRRTRKLHVFQHGGPGGVWSFDWDKLVFTVKKGGLLWGVMGYLPDQDGQVTHAFYLGAHVPAGSHGVGPDEPVLAHWEYFRRYMEEGTASVPTPEILLPINNRREPFLYGVQRLWGMFGPLSVVFLPVTTLAGVFRWIAMRLSRVPRWPAEVEAECRVAPDDVTPLPVASRSAMTDRAYVGMGTILILALDCVLLWLLVTRVFGVGRLLHGG
ncbi:DUF6708 domain-containing protein [Paraburkholderia bannensis]|uniref:DUF6708 domain-containing protein n=1 Tax=Paraburkholderia bannensis TaxID=765414 RepID=UPI002AB7C99B|nr:DUF6708 domain-containing protein [Paraburkholderia bannensis]